METENHARDKQEREITFCGGTTWIAWSLSPGKARELVVCYCSCCTKCCGSLKRKHFCGNIVSE